ncbi:hypothetical protein CPB86DRAFT_93071 [Serendipita vermifera]|nr:hypothetical protein CPB86DRAFT_93071 [Serendipita vermifera]
MASSYHRQSRSTVYSGIPQHDADDNGYTMNTFRTNSSYRSTQHFSDTSSTPFLRGNETLFTEKAISQMATYYSRGSRATAITGIMFSLLSAIAILIAGAIVWVKSTPANERGQVGHDRYQDNSQGILIYEHLRIAEWIPKLALNTLVTLCNVATGNVHSTILKWALISKGKPGFNANLRLLSSAGGFFSPNGWPANILHATCLIVSQASVSVVLLPGPQQSQTLIPSMAIVAIGSSLLLQSLLILGNFLTIHVPTWSTSPLDVAMAAKGGVPDPKNPNRPIEGSVIQYHRYRCLHSAADRKKDMGAMEPRRTQPSAWKTHKRVKSIVYLTWSLVLASFLWSYILFALIASDLEREYIHASCSAARFMPIVNTQDHCLVRFTFNKWAQVDGELPNNKSIAFNLALFIAFQGILALGLHCGELIVTLSRDEGLWRKASTGTGAKHSGNQLYNFISWQSLLFLSFNPLLHWIMGNSLVIVHGATAMYPMQIIWLTVGLTLIAILITFLSRRQPQGPQPSTFGHLQTLVDLIDEDAKILYWGNKAPDPQNQTKHAGTSARNLAPVIFGEKYA